MSRTLALVSAMALMAPAALAPAFASDRGLGAHEHGSGAFNIAFDGDAVLIELEAPGADIVGFEYEAKSDEDRAAIDAAKTTLAEPLNLFVMPADAGCTVTAASVELIAEGGHEGHDHGDHGHKDEHDHGDHGQGGEAKADDHDHDHAKKDDDHDQGHDEHAHGEDKDEHAHGEHAEDKHDHGEHAHDEHDHDKHDHEEHAGEGGHTEFHAEYALTCANRDAIDAIEFAYFAKFPNALELDVQLISAKGAKGFEVERDAPRLDLAGAI